MSSPSYRFLKDLGLSSLGRRSLFRVILMVTGRCPLRCATCGIWKRPEIAGDPALEEIAAFFGKNSFSWINLTGGEIFSREDAGELLARIAELQPELAHLSLPTSGFFTKRAGEGIEEGLRAGLREIHVTVSFDGGRETHNAMRRHPEAFERAMDTFRALRDLAGKSRGRLKVLPGLTLSAELLALHPDPVGALVQDLRLEGPHEVHVNVAHASSHYYGEARLDPLPSEPAIRCLEGVLEARQERRTALDWVERMYLKGALRYVATGSAPLRCKACSASVFVDPAWNVYPCTIFPERLGNLREQAFDLGAVKRSPAFGRVRARIAAGDCPGCWTPCEAFTAIAGSVLAPAWGRLALSRRAR